MRAKYDVHRMNVSYSPPLVSAFTVWTVCRLPRCFVIVLLSALAWACGESTSATSSSGVGAGEITSVSGRFDPARTAVVVGRVALSMLHFLVVFWSKQTA